MRLFSLRFFALWACVAALPVAVLVAALAQTARPVPIFDDYPAIVAFALQYQKLSTVPQKLGLLVCAQTGDYKLVFEHLLVALDLSLTHRLQLSFLIWAGNLIGLAIPWLLWHMHFTDERDLRRRLLLFLPVVFLFFQMNYVENFNWAMCGLQTFPAIFFCLAALILINRPSAGSAQLACLSALLASLSSSNGFLVAPLGALVYLRRKEWMHFSWWLATFAVAVSAYLYGYHPLLNLFHNENTTPQNRALFFLSFLGSAAENQHRHPIKYGAAVLGLFLLTILVTAFLRGFHHVSPSACYAAVWILLTAVPVLIYRLPAGFEYSLVMRYKIYSDLLLIFAYGFLASSVRTSSLGRTQLRLLYASSLILAIGFCISSDALGYRFLVGRQQRIALALDRFALSPTRSQSPDNAIDPFASALVDTDRLKLIEAIRIGIYALPAPGRR